MRTERLSSLFHGGARPFSLTMAMVLRRILLSGKAISLPSASPNAQADSFVPAFSRFFSKSAPYAVKVGIPEFLQGIGGGVEAHVAKLESEIGDLNRLLVSRTLKLKKLGIPCKHRKLILKYAHKYRVGLWRPRAAPMKA